MSNIAIIFAAGQGTRMNKQTPKQFLKIKKKPLLCYTIDVFENSSLIKDIVIVTLKNKISYVKNIINRAVYKKVIAVIEGGKSAIDSQFNALNYLHKMNTNRKDIIIIHDGVRPLINTATIKDAIELVKSKGNAIAVSPAQETISVTKENKIKDIIARKSCLLVRAPQAFYFNDIYNAHLKSRIKNLEFIDSASMMKYFKYKLYTFYCPIENIKVTTEHDFIVCKYFLTRNKHE